MHKVLRVGTAHVQCSSRSLCQVLLNMFDIMSRTHDETVVWKSVPWKPIPFVDWSSPKYTGHPPITKSTQRRYPSLCRYLKKHTLERKHTQNKPCTTKIDPKHTMIVAHIVLVCSINTYLSKYRGTSKTTTFWTHLRKTFHAWGVGILKFGASQTFLRLQATTQHIL
jgi:hypothetical protein